VRHEGVKRMVVRFEGDGDRLAAEGSPGQAQGSHVHWAQVHSHCRTGTVLLSGNTLSRHARGCIQTEKAFAAFWSMAFGNLALDLLR
jgi:hypothetical protein